MINADDAFAPYFAERAHGRRLIRFGLEASADVSARDVALDADGARFVLVTPQGEADDRAGAAGPPQRAATRSPRPRSRSARASPLDAIAAGLAAARAGRRPPGPHRLRNGAVLIDDSYNANPGSLDAAIDTLAAPAPAAKRWLVLGDMRELGADAAALHAEAGRRAQGRRHRAPVHARPAERRRGAGLRRRRAHISTATPRSPTRCATTLQRGTCACW